MDEKYMSEQFLDKEIYRRRNEKNKGKGLRENILRVKKLQI